MRLKYPFNLMAIGAMISFPPDKAYPAQLASHNYGKRHNMLFRSKRKCKGGNVIIIRVV